MSINRVAISGNLTRDPELKTVGSGSVLSMRVAVNDRRKNQQTGEWEDVPNFFDVSMWGARGEAVSRLLSKGSKVCIEGKLRWREWQTAEGEKRSTVSIIADEMELMGERAKSAEPSKAAAIPDDEIPF